MDNIQLETPTTEPEVTLDEEGLDDLFDDCRMFIEALLERQQPQWVKNTGLALLKRLNEATGYVSLH